MNLPEGTKSQLIVLFLHTHGCECTLNDVKTELGIPLLELLPIIRTLERGEYIHRHNNTLTLLQPGDDVADAPPITNQ